MNPMKYRASRTLLGLLWDLNPALFIATAKNKNSVSYRWSPNWQCVYWSMNFQPNGTLLPMCSGGSWDNAKWQCARARRRAQDAHSICQVLVSRGAEGNWERKHHDLSKRSLQYNQTPFSVRMGWPGDAAVQVSGSRETPHNTGHVHSAAPTHPPVTTAQE